MESVENHHKVLEKKVNYGYDEAMQPLYLCLWLLCTTSVTWLWLVFISELCYIEATRGQHTPLAANVQWPFCYILFHTFIQFFFVWSTEVVTLLVSQCRIDLQNNCINNLHSLSAPEIIWNDWPFFFFLHVLTFPNTHLSLVRNNMLIQCMRWNVFQTYSCFFGSICILQTQ